MSRNSAHSDSKDEISNVDTGGDYLIKLLNKKGIQFIFGTTGSGMPDIQDANVLVKPPKWIQGLHEFVSISAAAGYGLATENVGVAMVDRISGVQNGLGAIYGAYFSCSPLAVLASENLPGVPISTGAPEYHYGSNANSVFGPWVKWRSNLNSLETLPEELEHLFRHALSEPMGPTALSLRQDLMAERMERGRFPPKREAKYSPRIPDDETSEKIVDELASHEMPVLVTSHLGRHKNNVYSLFDFTETFGTGVMERRAFFNFPIGDKLHLGFIGDLAAPNLSQGQHDLVLSIDTGLLPHQQYGTDTDIIELISSDINGQFVIGGGDYGSSLIPAKISAVVDSGPTLRKLIKTFEKSKDKYKKESVANRKALFNERHNSVFEKSHDMAEKSYSMGKMSSYSIGYVINNVMEDDFTWLNGAFTQTRGLLETVGVRTPGSYFGNPSGHLGMEIGMSYGVAMANKRYSEISDHKNFKSGKIVGPSHPVICTTGDGSAIFGNIGSALWTCSHYGIGVVYIVLNNRCWGVEWHGFASTHHHRAKDAEDFEFLDLDQPEINFSAMAGGFNVRGITANTLEEFENGLKEAIILAKKGRPSLIDVKLPKSTGENKSSVL